MPAIVKHLGTERITPHLQSVIAAMVLGLCCENRLAMNAAGFAIDDIRELVGEEHFDQHCTEDQLSKMKASTYVHTIREPRPNDYF